MDEATLRAIFDEKLNDVCKKEDLVQVNEKLDKHEGRLEEMERRLQALEAGASASDRLPRTSTGSITSASSRGNHPGQSGEWQPRLVLVRGSHHGAQAPSRKSGSQLSPPSKTRSRASATLGHRVSWTVAKAPRGCRRPRQEVAGEVLRDPRK